MWRRLIFQSSNIVACSAPACSAPLRVRSAVQRHQSPARPILRQISSLMYPKIQRRQVIMNVLHPSCARSPRWSPPVLWRRFEDGLARLILDGRNSRVVQFYTPGPVASWSTERRNSGCHSFIHSYSFISTTVDKKRNFAIETVTGLKRKLM